MKRAGKNRTTRIQQGIPSSYLMPALTGRRGSAKGGHSVVAVQDITAGSLVAMLGGEVIDGETLAQFAPARIRRTMQVAENLYIWSSVDGPADWINHSCDPNAGLCGQIALVAMRNIGVGEEVCFDYAMCDGTPYDEFECQCGSSLCRGLVTGDDWRRPELWERYQGHFSPYLQARINDLKMTEEELRRHGPLVYA